MEDNAIIGRAKRDIEAGETVATVDMSTGEVFSDNIEFVEGGENVVREIVWSFRRVHGLAWERGKK